jgi:hypothetical protein
VALTANLRHELVENLRQLLDRLPTDGTVEPSYRFATSARAQFSGGPMDESRIKGKRLMWLSLFALVGSTAGGRLATQFLDEALVSGEFLDFDKASDHYVVGPLQHAMVSLRDEILRLRREEGALTFDERRWLVENFRPLKDEDDLVPVENRRLVGIMSLHDRHENTVRLSAAILRALAGDVRLLGSTTLWRATPFAEEAVQIERETPTVKNVEEWVNAVNPDA